MSKDDLPAVVFVVMILVFIVFLGCWITEYATSSTRLVDATVIDRAYTPSSNSTGVGLPIDGKGGPVVTNHYTPEKWTVIVRVHGKIVPMEVDSHIWAAVERGIPVKVNERIGGTFGTTMSQTLVVAENSS